MASDPTPDKYDLACWNQADPDAGIREAERLRAEAKGEAALFDLEAEKSILGGWAEQGFGPKAAGLMPNDFGPVEHQLIVAAAIGLEEAKLAINPVSLADRLDAAECPELDQLGRGQYFELLRSKYGFNARLDNLATYASIIREKSDRRRLIGYADAMRAGALNGKKPGDTAREIIGRLEGMAKPKTGPQFVRASDMRKNFTGLRKPITYGLQREGETININAAPKTGKSWLAIDYCLAIATGRHWLGTFETVQGAVVYIDNECHTETTADRIPRVADARMIRAEEYEDNLHVLNLRGCLTDINGIVAMLMARFSPGELRLVVVDALYRALPKDISENDPNIGIVYNAIDACAMELGCGFALIHHHTKGSQANKSVTDVGSGSGVQSRATDTHFILRPHEQAGVVVAEAAVRSWAPLEPRCIRWEFPVWQPADDCDPALLKPERPRRAAKPKPEGDDTPPPPVWTWERFGPEIVGKTYKTKAEIMADALAANPSFSKRSIDDLLDMAVAKKAVTRFYTPGSTPLFSTSTEAPPAQGGGGGAHTPRTPRVKKRTASPRGKGRKRRPSPTAPDATEAAI